MDPILEMPNTRTGPLHVMVVDDEDDYHLITRLMLRKAGFSGKLSAFLNPEEALDHLHTSTDHPDILFVDINMPSTDGFQFLERCEERNLLSPDFTTVIMCSSSNRPVDMEMARKAHGVRAYVEKPLTHEQFMLIATEHINREQAQNHT